MSSEIIRFITNYGYLAIFTLVFLQEMGVPNPVPNEFVLMFSGYLSYTGVLQLPFVLFAAVSADFIGTNILYAVFFFFGSYLIKHIPRWFPISEKSIVIFSKQISKAGKWKLFIARLIPFIRGYTSIVSGLIQLKPKTFIPTVLFSAILWASGYVLAGKLAGSYWSIMANRVSDIRAATLYFITITFFILIARYIIRRIWFKNI